MGFRSDALELAKLDPKFGFLPLNGNKRPLFSWKDEHPDGFTIEQCLEHQNCQALGVLLGINLICLDFDGESSVDFAGFNNIDFDYKTWQLIILKSNHLEIIKTDISLLIRQLLFAYLYQKTFLLEDVYVLQQSAYFLYLCIMLRV